MKKLFPWLILAVVIRLILIPLYTHPDIRGFNFAAYLITQKSESLSFYDYLSYLPRTHQLVKLYHDDLFIYPPLAYLTPALFMKILSPLYPWPLFNQLIYDINVAVADPQMPYLNYLLKFPYLIADFLCLIYLRKLVDDKHKHVVSLVWLFNPVNLYVTYLISQFDIYISLLLIASLYYSHKNLPTLSSMLLGLAAGFKPFPLFFLPFVNKDKSIISRISSVLIGLSVYMLTVLPYFSSPGFRQYALFADQTQKLFFAKIMISSSTYISIFMLGLGVLVWFNYHKHDYLPTWGWLGLVTLIFYSFSHFHPQWIMWGLPFFVISYSIKPVTRPTLFASMTLYFIIVLTFEASLNVNIIHQSITLSDMLDKLKLTDTFLSVIKSLFASTSLYLTFQWAKKLV
jgi:hypothetical protein